MKVEIELGDLESLRQTLKLQNKEIIDLKKQIQETDFENQRYKVITLAKIMFNSYMKSVCNSLGIEWNIDYFDAGFHDYVNKLITDDQKWKDVDTTHYDGIECEVGVKMTTKFKEAFANFTIINDKNTVQNKL